jgi:hypothetical protein
MNIDRSLYQASHGKMPKGYGLWMFALGRGRLGVTTFSFTGTFGDALAAAKRNAKSIDCDRIAVQP